MRREDVTLFREMLRALPVAPWIGSSTATSRGLQGEAKRCVLHSAQGSVIGQSNVSRSSRHPSHCPRIQFSLVLNNTLNVVERTLATKS